MKKFTGISEQLNQYIITGIAVIGIIGILQTFLHFGVVSGICFALIPFISIACIFLFKKSSWMYIIVFIVNYYISGISRYINIPIGIVMDILLIITIVFLLISSGFNKVKWKQSINGLTIVSLIWLLYCIMELFNPQVASSEAWATSIRGVATYFFVISLLTPIIFCRFADLKKFLMVWAILTLTAVMKAIWQKHVGFDSAEKYWLYVLGGSTTHIIYSGIRYFSFFSDAANFGAGMGFSMVVFGITSFYTNNKRIKVFYRIVSLAAGYGLLLSGTRAALAVPFAGIGIFTLLSKNIKSITLGLFALIGAFIFLFLTDIGQGNQQIRRMRSAFNTEDASFQVRMTNQAKMKTYMSDKPFGVGLGLGGGKAKRYAPDAYMSQIATDSWFVMIWVETGIIGLILHLVILIFIIIYGTYISIFQLKNKELKGIHNALVSGVFGMMVASYANEIFGQFPNGFIIYACQAFIFLSLSYDNELTNQQQNNNTHELQS